MDKEAGEGENKVRIHSDRDTEEYFISVSGDKNEAVSAEMPTSDPEEKHCDSGKVTEEFSAEEAATFEPEAKSEDELCTEFDVMIKVKEQPLCHKESVVSEMNSTYHDDALKLHPETQETEISSPLHHEDEEAEKEGATSACAQKLNIKYKEYRPLLQEVSKERDKARHNSSQLQMKLAQYFKKAGDSVQLEGEKPVSEQLQEYERYINILTDLKQQLRAESEAAQRQAEDLRLQSQEQLGKVEDEWRALMALKQDTAVKMLSRRLGKEAARAKVEASLRAEQLRQDELIKLRLKHIKLNMKICKLEAELRHGEEHDRDPIQIQFEQLQAEKLEQKKQAEKQHEGSVKLQKKISSSLECLSHIKEKLRWCQMEVKVKREQLTEVEAVVAGKRDHLTRVKQENSRLHRQNLRLKEQRGLLGNRVLLQDFEDTVNASDQLEEQLEHLKCRQAEILFSCGEWKSQ
ncbi:coiled-coil domain-containing protein 96 [Haplochromis burtoni]|uniref:Cilia and flagella associated protein 184 n=1 Tax=Haplochromis burtoni TaxID=8153 RepID=A0A3Q2VG43_HAPBU|nr:coiled-coil domain-containing protein 96 [Haplochromis burtoni]